MDNWLNSRRDLEAGRELLRSLSHSHQVNGVILDMVTKYSNSGTSDLIAKELVRIRSSISQASRPAPKSKSAKFRDMKEQIDLTPALQKLYDNTKIWYREKDALKHQSRSLPDGEELRDVNLKIIRFAKKIKRAYDRLDHFTAFGQDPGDHFDDLPRDSQIEQLTSWLRALKSHPPYISKNRKSEDPKIMEEVKRRKKELAAINKYLENAG
jgi:hypothetical protein